MGKRRKLKSKWLKGQCHEVYDCDNNEVIEEKKEAKQMEKEPIKMEVGKKEKRCLLEIIFVVALF